MNGIRKIYALFKDVMNEHLTVKIFILLILVFDSIEEFAPGFKSSVIARDILTPPDLEKIFGLTGGVSELSV